MLKEYGGRRQVYLPTKYFKPGIAVWFTYRPRS